MRAENNFLKENKKNAWQSKLNVLYLIHKVKERGNQNGKEDW